MNVQKVKVELMKKIYLKDWEYKSLIDASYTKHTNMLKVKVTLLLVSTQATHHQQTNECAESESGIDENNI